MERADEHTLAGTDDWREICCDDVDSGSSGMRNTGTVRQLALVLDSQAIPCLIEARDGGMHLLVPPEQYERAISELRCYVRENDSGSFESLEVRAHDAVATAAWCRHDGCYRVHGFIRRVGIDDPKRRPNLLSAGEGMAVKARVVFWLHVSAPPAASRLPTPWFA